MDTKRPTDPTALIAEVNDCLDRLRHWHAGIGPRDEDPTALAKRLFRALSALDALGRRPVPKRRK